MITRKLRLFISNFLGWVGASFLVAANIVHPDKTKDQFKEWATRHEAFEQAWKINNGC